ncbi:hypothetical protein [Magnetospirillum sulfuroxidans]|uniref:Flagellar protein FliL n=1 Tax=Magnetospirillum sulfuroxidans TaxID=611300 RepID=A0ABS5IEL3_9PROT|nr:hypothetical protein [Magnetospirillum sulfuroxidans]MBR9972854.1 hypothetical protein [Magnetospirillum sulfuroxidans]
MKRRLFLGAVLALPALPALASGGAKGNEVFVKLPTVNVEYWDEAGIFHMVVVDASVVFHEQGTKIDKTIGILISHALSAMTWEEFSRGNPAATVKAIALDLVRKQPGAEKAVEVLLGRLIIR